MILLVCYMPLASRQSAKSKKSGAFRYLLAVSKTSVSRTGCRRDCCAAARGWFLNYSSRMRLTALAMIAVLRGSRALTRTVLRAAASTSATPKRVLVPIADGSEEIETCCITDTLVRAGAEVTVASVEATTTCTMSRGLKIVADALVTDLGNDQFDLVALPGGMPGAERLRDSDALDAILRKQDARRAPLAAVCASPAVILKSKGLIDGRQATCYPAPPFVEALGDVSDGAVVRDGHITTSRGPGTSLKFALDLVDQLYGPEKAEELRAQMLVD